MNEKDVEINTLNVQSCKVNGKKNLLKNGKINALLDQMEIDASENLIEANANLAKHWRAARYCSSECEVCIKLNEDIDVQKAAYALARSIRKYTPFIEVEAMTIAEAISCETQIKATKPSEKS